MDTKYLNLGDGPVLSYATAGAGPPVLLIHGFTMWSGMWQSNGVVDALSPDAKLLVPDLRAHGKSSKPHDTNLYGMSLVHDLVALLNHEGIAEADIVGFSLGAELALKLATTHPDRVSSLFLIGSGWSDVDVMPIYRNFAAWARKTGKVMTPDPDYDALDALVVGMPQIIDLTKDDVERIDLPCAGVVGGDDPERPNLEKLVGVLPGFSLDVLPGVPHETSWRHPSIPNRINRFRRLLPHLQEQE